MPSIVGESLRQYAFLPGVSHEGDDSVSLGVSLAQRWGDGQGRCPRHLTTSLLDLETDSAPCVSTLDTTLIASWVKPKGLSAIVHTLGTLAKHEHLTA